VCAGVALAQVAVGLAARYGVGPRPSVSRRTTAALLGVTAAAALAVGFVAGVPGKLSDRWEAFKEPGRGTTGLERLESAEGNFRYQIWESALDANASDPITGIGPGTFEYWWAQHKEVDTFVRDGHSLYLETLAEVGVVGLALLLGFIGTVLVVGSRGAFRGSEERRAMLAAATAACAVLALAATIDWVWELPVLPVTFLVLAAAILGNANPRRRRSRGASGAGSSRARSIAARAAPVAFAAASLVVIASPMASAMFVRQSQEDVKVGDFGSAVESARDAKRFAPFAARPVLQEALVLELDGNLDGAVSAARRATSKEPGNWRNWFALSRIEAKLGNTGAAVEAAHQARSLNPRSQLFFATEERELRPALKALDPTR
jgi:O-Antigen ligase